MAPPSPHAASKDAAAEATNVVARGELRCETPQGDLLAAPASVKFELSSTAQFALPPDEVAPGNAAVPLKVLLRRRVGVFSLRAWLLAVFAFVFVAVLAVVRARVPEQKQNVSVRRVHVTSAARASVLAPNNVAGRSVASPATAAEALFAGDLQRAKEQYSRLASKDQRFETFARIVERKLRSGCEGSTACLSVVRGNPL